PSTTTPDPRASCQCGPQDCICVFGWAHYFQTVYLSWHFGHAVIEGSNGLTGNVELAHIEELDRFKRASLCLFQDVLRRRSRYLIPIQLAISQIASAGIADNFDVIPADFRLVRHPSSCHGSTNHVVFVISKAEKNSISDDIPVVVYSHELLRLIAAEIGEAINTSIRH